MNSPSRGISQSEATEVEAETVRRRRTSSSSWVSDITASLIRSSACVIRATLARASCVSSIRLFLRRNNCTCRNSSNMRI
jgi:N-formylglutamate amidohydrolase